MVGSRGKGSRSKPKDIKSVPAEPVPLKNSLDEAADVASDKEDGENDSLNKNEIPLEEELMDEMISGFIVSDGNGETEQNAHKLNDDEKDILAEANGEDFQEGKIDDVKEVSGGDADNEKVMEDEAKPEEDETPSEELNNDDARNAITENMAHDLENHKEPSKLDTDEPVGAPSDREEEHIENASITDNVKEVTGKVDKPKRKVIKRKLVKKKMVSGGDAATNVGVEDPEKRTEDETKPEDDETLSKELNNDDARNGITENMMHNLENHKEPSKLDADESVGTPSDREEERIENANIADDVKEVTGKVDKPKRKVIKRKLVKKKVVRRCATAVSEEMPHPSDENNASGEVCKVDTNELVMDEVKASDVDATPVEEYKEDINEHVDNEEKDDVKSSVKINKKQIRIRKKKAPQGQSGVATVKDARKPLASEGHIGTSDPRVKNEEVEESGDRASPSKRNKNKKMGKKGSQEVVPKDVNKPKPSKEGKSSKRIDSMGMIFMCSSETKKDCYHYKVLGLPAGKKDMVLKIYKGMRLFLFDVDLRMMYGIYKAASPGGYNIEPKAFKSQFPSQVRFVVLEDCVPLAEERFRKVLKDNYYTRNKFNCQLNSEQVKNLCKLFHETNKKAESTKAASRSRRAAGTSSAAKAAASASRRAAAISLSAQAASASRRAAAASSFVRRDKKRKRVEDRPRRASPLRGRERSWRISPAELRHPPLVIADRYYERPTYERASYLPSAAPAATLYQPLPARSPPRTNTYSYDRISEVDDPYRRHMVIDRRDLIPASRESRLPIEPDRYEPYVSYRDPPQVSPTYTTSDGRYADYYRPADYRPPPPLYRRY